MLFTSLEFLFLFLPLVLAAYFWSREMIVPFVCAAAGSAPILKARCLSGAWLAFPGYAIQFALFVVSISCLVMKAHNPFIYFNF